MSFTCIYIYIRMYNIDILFLSHVLARDIFLKCLVFGLQPAITCSPGRGF